MGEDERTRAFGSGDKTGDGERGEEAEAESDAALERPSIGGVFELERELGRGGMGVVYSAREPRLDRSVALKILRDVPETAVRMFEREARITGRLDHPNIPAVHTVGESEDGRRYFTMKQVEGETLEALLDRDGDGPLSHERLLDHLGVIDRVCDALAFAHARGYVHCDLKPENVMVGEFGQVYLMDWGIALEHPDLRARYGDATSEDAKNVFGTVVYMSPEQARGERANMDPRSDVFAVGAMLYRIVMGRPPYSGKTSWVQLDRASRGDWDRLDCARTSAELSRIIERAMAADVDDRYPDIPALQRDLDRFVRGGDSFPRRVVEAGELVVREGEPGDAAYVVVDGQCEIYQDLPAGRRSIRVLGPGGVFGETAILTRAPRTANVVALERSVLLTIDAANFEQELDSVKPWLGAFVRQLAARFRALDHERRDSLPNE